MRNVYIIGILLIIFMGCSNKIPKHYYGTDNLDSTELSVISIRSNEIVLLELDGTKYLGKKNFLEGDDDVYIKPGKHKFKAQLFWETFIGSTVIFRKSKKYIEGCIDMKPGKHYHLYARDPGDSWRFVYSIIGKNSSIIDIPKCK